MSLVDEIRKIPPVTRFLCGSSLVVTLSVMMKVVSPYKVIFVRELVTHGFEIWRPFTSFFLGGSGINYLFDFIMLYRNSNQLESSYYIRQSADYAWQLAIVATSIIALNLPLGSFVHTRPLLVALTYLTSRLAPPGAQTSLFGLVSIPLVYFPYALIVLDLIMAGPGAAATSITGAVAGHLWWWTVWDTRMLQALGRAPAWLKALIGNSDGNAGSGSASGGTSGVHVVPPRRLREEASSSGHRWGTGNRLGSS